MQKLTEWGKGRARGSLPIVWVKTISYQNKYDDDEGDDCFVNRYGDECCEGKCSLLHFVVVLILAGALDILFIFLYPFHLLYPLLYLSLGADLDN